jgi:hypothetical protein
MPDDFDRATEAQLADLDNQIAKVRKENVKKLLHTGFCYYCGENVPSPRAFCDGQCRDDFEYEQERLRINGKL